MNGYDVEIIDYVNQKIDDELKISQESSGKSLKNKWHETYRHHK